MSNKIGLQNSFETKKYSEQTIRLYLNELEKIDIVDFKSAKDLDVFINSTVNNAKNQGLTKSHIDSLRAGLHQLFLMSFGITIKEYRSQNNSKDFIELLLDDFLITLLILNHKQFLLQWLKKVILELS